MTSRPRVFGASAAAIAVGFSLAVALLFLGDLVYVVEFAARAEPERAAEVVREVVSRETRSELLLSLATATITTLIALAVAIPGGYALSRFRLPAKVVLDTLVDAAIVLPPLILGVSLLVLFSLVRRAGEALGSAGEPQPVLDAIYRFFVYERPGIVLAQLFVSTALCIRTLRAAFDAADRRVEAVALTLGCTPFGAFLHAALPQATSGVLAGAVLSWSYAIGLFAPVAIFAGTVRGRTAVLPTRTYLEVSVGHLEIALVLTLAMAALSLTVLIAFKCVVGRSIAAPGGPP